MINRSSARAAGLQQRAGSSTAMQCCCDSLSSAPCSSAPGRTISVRVFARAAQQGGYRKQEVYRKPKEVDWRGGHLGLSMKAGHATDIQAGLGKLAALACRAWPAPSV